MTEDATPAVTRHPLADAIGDGWVASETRAPVVWLSELLADLLHVASQHHLVPVLITAPSARLTPAAAEALTSVGGRWLLRSPDGDLFDGIRGTALAHPSEVVHARRAPRASDLAPAFLRVPATGDLQLFINVSMRHRVTRPVRLGGVADALATRLTGHAPATWGASEPLTAPWDRAQLTEFTRQRMPRPARWAIAGGGERAFAATIAVSRTPEGLEETTHAWIDRGQPGEPAAESMADDAMEALRGTREHGMPLFATAVMRFGTDDLSRRAAVEVPANPLALMIGPPGVRALGRPGTWWRDEFDATLLGSPRIPGVLVPLGDTGNEGWTPLIRVIRALDPARLGSLLGADDYVDRAAERAMGGDHA